MQSLTTSNGNHPAFKTFLAAQARENARGFLSKEITVRSMLEHRGDVHHIFPRDYLKKKFGLTRSQYNQVANYVYTQQEINIAIGNSPPEEYMGKVRGQCETKEPVYGGITEPDDLYRNLEESAVPADLLNGGLTSYNDFLAERRTLMSAVIRDYYHSL